MKILFVIDTLNNAGAENSLLIFCKALKKSHEDFDVVFIGGSHDLLLDFEEASINVLSLNISNRWNLFEQLTKLSPLISKNKYQIVHSHLFHSFLPVSIIRIFCMRSFYHIRTLHNRGYDAYPPFTFLKKVRRFIEKQLVRFGVDYSIAVSESVKRSAQKHLSVKRIDVIGNGIDLENLKRFVSLQIQSKKPIKLILPGRLVWEKGHHYFIEALELISEYDFEATIIGDGPKREELHEKVILSKLSGKLELLPAIPQCQLFELISKKDIVVIPSIMEGWGMVVAEAMALGKPVVTTNVGGISDVLGDLSNAIICKPKSSEDLAQKLKLLIVNPILRKELSFKSVKRSKELSVDNVVSKSLKLYKKVMSKK